jgi:ribosomal protein S18 acetylase RimI-like enzyme
MFMIYFRMMISFVRLGPSDAALLSKVGGITIFESHGHSAPADVMQAYVDKNFNEEACRAELTEEDNIFQAIIYNHQPAGYSKIVFDCPHPAVPLLQVTKMERLYLLKEFHGLDLGRRLMQKAIGQSKAQEEQGMWLNVWKGNDRAIRFYQKQGFETIGESEFVLTPTHSNPTWIMLMRY